MPRRIDIELTSALADGSWTWRAAGARVPKGVLDGQLLSAGAAVGDQLKVEVEQELDGIEVKSVVQSREKTAPDLLELLPVEVNFAAVIETRAKRDRNERPGGGDGRRGRRDDRGGRDDRKGRPGSGEGRRDGRGRDAGAPDDGRSDARRGPRRPHFDPPPEVPLRPKPKRLRPGKARRGEVLASIPEEQRPIAELAIQGMAAVRTRLAEDNKKLAADGKPTMPQDSVLKMAEELMPKLRVADWLDRAEAAERQMEHLDLRDLRSVVVGSDDPMVARDESTRAIAEKLKVDLVKKQEQELKLWLEDVDASLSVGRSIRALRLSSQPPKAGVMFPPDLARKLSEAATAGLTADDSSDRWAAVMEAAAFSPVRTLVAPTAPPSTITDELRATALRLGPLLPQIAALLGVDVPAGAPRPKPLRPGPRTDNKRKRPPESGSAGREGERKDNGPGDRKERAPHGPKPAKSNQADGAPTPLAATDLSIAVDPVDSQISDDTTSEPTIPPEHAVDGVEVTSTAPEPTGTDAEPAASAAEPVAETPEVTPATEAPAADTPPEVTPATVAPPAEAAVEAPVPSEDAVEAPVDAETIAEPPLTDA
jgi:hypothetical protein